MSWTDDEFPRGRKSTFQTEMDKLAASLFGGPPGKVPPYNPSSESLGGYTSEPVKSTPTRSMKRREKRRVRAYNDLHKFMEDTVAQGYIGKNDEYRLKGIIRNYVRGRY